MATLVAHAVVDSGAFIRNAPLKDIASNIYTVKEVVSEIRDKETLLRLQVLPYEIIFREPSAESIKTVTDFTKMTGDYPSLSATDLRVMALTYELEKEHVGIEHIRTAPNRKVQFSTTARLLEKPTDIAGFYLGVNAVKLSQPSTGQATSDATPCAPIEACLGDSCDGRQSKDPVIVASLPQDADVSASNVCKSQEQSDAGEGHTLIGVWEGGEEATEVGEGDSEDLHEASEDNERDDGIECDEDDDDDGGWITPSNLKQVQASMHKGPGNGAAVSSAIVGCVTTDFAMQNVLIQMALNVISVDGLLIKTARSYALRCAACFKITTNMTKQFCHHCGNKMLQKVSVTVKEDGTMTYFLSRRKPVTTRGLKFSLPTPKGGKHAANPRLVEDQPAPQQRASKLAQRRQQLADVFADDYVARSSPFATHDVVSRAARLGIRDAQQLPPGADQYWSRRNPNEARRHKKK